MNFKAEFLKKLSLSLALVVIVILALLLIFRIDKTYIYAFLVVVLVSSFLARNFKLNDLSNGLTLGLFVSGIVYFINFSIAYFSVINEWDFVCFYFYGKIGASGGNFYDTSHTLQLFYNLQLASYTDSSFTEEIAKVGFIYPPPTMLLFITLGYFDIGTSLIIWKTLILISSILALFLALNYFNIGFKNPRLLFLLASIFLVYSETRATIGVSQTNFILIILIIFMLVNLNNWKLGLYLAIAVIVKPIVLIWAVYLLITKKIKALAAFVISGIIICAFVISVFGFNQFSQYLTASPANKLPSSAFTEIVNQSLSSVLIRNFAINDFKSANVRYATIILSALIFLLGIFSSLKLEKQAPALAFLLFIPLSLIIYPGALTHYSVMLLPIYFYFLVNSQRAIFLAIVVGGFLILSHYSSFTINILTFILIASSMGNTIFGLKNPESDLAR